MVPRLQIKTLRHRVQQLSQDLQWPSRIRAEALGLTFPGPQPQACCSEMPGRVCGCATKGSGPVGSWDVQTRLSYAGLVSVSAGKFALGYLLAFSRLFHAALRCLAAFSVYTLPGLRAQGGILGAGGGCFQSGKTETGSRHVPS